MIVLIYIEIVMYFDVEEIPDTIPTEMMILLSYSYSSYHQGLFSQSSFYI